MTVRITNIQHFSLHDGPGIRTTVFLKSCNLKCPWCCNPENINFEIENYGTGDSEKFGYDISLDDLEKEILKDSVFYEYGGGVTFSGGEPLLQIKSLEPLLKSLKEQNINICFETALSVPKDLVKIAIKYADYLYVDIKILDVNKAKSYLNMDINCYLENLDLISKSNKNICFRIPLSNEYTLTEDNVSKIMPIVKKYSNCSIEIFKVHNLAESKYKSLNRELLSFSEVSDDDVNNFFNKISSINPNVKIIKL